MALAMILIMALCSCELNREKLRYYVGGYGYAQITYTQPNGDSFTTITQLPFSYIYTKSVATNHVKLSCPSGHLYIYQNNILMAEGYSFIESDI